VQRGAGGYGYGTRGVGTQGAGITGENSGRGANGNLGAGSGSSGVVIISHPSTVVLTIGPGLSSTSDTTSVPGSTIVTFTAGTGNISWSI
jgi:hypothetical protein